MNRLEIGKRGLKPGWTTLDVVGPADIVAPAVPLPDAVTSLTWDVVQMIHVLEHFTLDEATRLLKSLQPITRHVVIEVPNLAFAAERLLEHHNALRDDMQMTMWPIYGDQRHGPEYAHKWGYTPQSLSRLLRRTGWSNIRQTTPRYHVPVRDLRVEADGLLD